jgi:tRNA(Ile)-lysidine synthase
VGQSLVEAITGFSPELPLAVAYSGGADSTALLLACAEKWPGRVVAIHVNHDLQAAAADFQTHCETFCAQLGVPLLVQKVDGRAAPGQSPEDAARIARYQSFSAASLIQQAWPAIKNIVFEDPVFRSLALAQHADDQVETILLALGRGAGLAGLSGMAAQWQRDGVSYFRPLLSVSSADIRAWLAGRGASFIEDPTNADERFTRNRVRARLLPVLQEVFPHLRDTFARSARHVAQAQGLLDELAQADFAQITALAANAPGDAVSKPAVNVAMQDLTPQSLTKLSRPRQANVLRFWLKQQFNQIPSTAQLEELLDQVAACTTRGHQIHIKIGSGFVKRQGKFLTWYNP